MVSHHSPDFSAFPESPYAAALRDGGRVPFEGAMEEDYLRARLWDGRTLIRAACTLGAMLGGERVIEHLVTGGWQQPVFLTLAFILLSTVALAVLAWSPLFERAYAPIARVIVPARNAIAAVPIAAGAAAGSFELLLFLPLMIVGPFFFLGLRYRVAVLSSVAMLASFTGGAVVAGLALPFILRAAVFLALCIVACAVSSRHFDRWCRTSFLESRLITELVELDPLTGAKNRRVFDEHLARLWQQGGDDRRPLAILLVDVDHFKAF